LRVSVNLLANKTLVIYIEQGNIVHVVTTSPTSLKIGGDFKHELKMRLWEEVPKAGDQLYFVDTSKHEMATQEAGHPVLELNEILKEVDGNKEEAPAQEEVDFG